ncbi:MAG TPA: glycosyltransferase family 39 protein [Candidatus Limnocylindria bacterium]
MERTARPSRRPWLQGVSLLAAAALAAGLLLLIGSALPYAQVLRRLVGMMDAADLARMVAAGLLLTVAGSIGLALARSRNERLPVRAMVVLALVVPVAVGGVVAAASARAILTPGLPIATGARLLLLAAPLATVVAPLMTVMVGMHLPPRTPGPPRRLSREGTVLGLLLAAFAAIVLLGLLREPPFTWDEAVYALTARHWLLGTPDSGWGPHRPLVLSALGVLPMLVGSEEWLFRLIGLAFGVGAVAATWYLARALAGPVAGLLAAATVAAIPSVGWDAGLLLNDVPATAILVAGTGMLWRIMERPAPIGWSLLWLAPIAAAAFYVRYGSIISIAALGLVAMVIWPSRLAAGWRPVLLSAGLLVVLLLPHAIFASQLTGSPLGIAFTAQSNARPDFPGAALVQYVAWLPGPLMGLVPAALAVLGLAGAAYRLAGAAARGRWDAGARCLALLVLPALIQVAVLGLAVLPQGRYIYFPLVLLAVAGVVVLADGMRIRGPKVGRAIRDVSVFAVAVSLVAAGALVAESADTRIARSGWERELGRFIGAMTDGDCAVLASDVPQVTWYSGCAAVSFGDVSRADRDTLLTGRDRFLVVRNDGQFQPGPAVMARYLARVDPQPLAVFEDGAGRGLTATLYRFTR